MSDLNQFGAPRRHCAGLAPILIGGALAAFLLVTGAPLLAWLRGFLSELPKPGGRGGTALLDGGLPLELIRDAIVGRGKSGVAAVFGVPRTAADVPRGARGNFWSADTWYYPIATDDQTAMAVRFQRGIAKAVEFFQSPRRP